MSSHMTQRHNRHSIPVRDLRSLRARLARFERLDRLPVLPLGLKAIDAHLPWGGLPCGCLHEVIDRGDGASIGFAGALLARLSARGPVLWLTSRDDLYPAGLERLGSPGWTRRLLVVETRRAADTLWAMEESLRAPSLAGVLAETPKLTLKDSRRLQLAAETRAATGLILRRLPAGTAAEDIDSALPASAAVTRWCATTLPSHRAQGRPDEDKFNGIGFSRWRVELLRCRGGKPRLWTMEQNDETGAFAVVTEILDRQDRADEARLAV